MHQASCLCRSVTWDVEGPIDFMSHCHCSRCSKTHGVSFATYAAVPETSFRLHGAEHVVRWESSPGFFRCFCGRCGSVVPGDAADGLVFVPAGNFDDDPGARPLAHIFVASKAPWYEIRDELLRFDTYPQGVDGPIVADRAVLDPPGRPRGSCLCGGVSFVLEGAPLRCLNCHCSRCRKARAAAHGSNVATPVDGVRFIRGTDLFVSYKPPGAQHFTQVFCRTCGSPVPRISPERGIAIVPMGSLDDDPGIRPQAHIFVGSKAPWYEIADALPQHAEYPT